MKNNITVTKNYIFCLMQNYCTKNSLLAKTLWLYKFSHFASIFVVRRDGFLL